MHGEMRIYGYELLIKLSSFLALNIIRVFAGHFVLMGNVKISMSS